MDSKIDVADCGCEKHACWDGLRFCVDILPCKEHTIKYQFLQQKIDILREQADEANQKYTALLETIDELRREGGNIAQFKPYIF